MALTPVEFSRFGGLDLRDDAQEVSGGAAVDCLNVVVDQQGYLRQRSGYASFASLTSGDTPLLLKRSLLGFVAITKSSGGFLTYSYVAINGTVTSNRVYPAVTAGTYAWGTGDVNNNFFYTTDGVSNLYRDGLLAAAVSGVGGGPLAVTPWDNRLVAGNTDRVKFSNPGDPVTFGANNWVDVGFADGETIREIVAWRDQLFVFKQTKFFVFYGTSVDGSGNPIFNYRPVVAGQGVSDAQGAVATPEGVYFVNQSGVWLTTGGSPSKVSTPVDPVFRQDRTLPYTSSAITSVVTSATKLSLTAAGRQLYVFTGTNNVLAMDRDTGTWTAHSLPVAAAAGFTTALTAAHQSPPDDLTRLFFQPASSNVVYQLDGTSTTDAGAAMSARWRSGFWNPGQPGAESVVREWIIDGSGTVSLKTAVNDGITLGSAASVSLGTAPAVAQGRDRRSVRGRNVSLEISGTAPWSVSRMIANLRGQRNAGLKAS